MEVNKKRLIIVQGPTASGKTKLSIDLARHFSTEIISGDSKQFYKEMIIGTARPSLLELSSVNHHFIGSHSIKKEFNTSDFAKEARTLCDDLFKKNNFLVLVGGSGMYIDALTYGLDDTVSDATIRESLIKTLANEGLEVLVEELRIKDPLYFSTADIKNPVRVIRALEVIRATNKTFSSLRKGFKNDFPYEVIRFSINWKREDLYDKINFRVDEMIENGLIEEVRNLYGFRKLNTLKTVGYTEIFDFLDAKCTLTEAIEKIKQHSRNYAKRQSTWLKRYSDMNFLNPYSNEDLLTQAINKLSN